MVIFIDHLLKTSLSIPPYRESKTITIKMENSEIDP
jgi:hypothetical protein